ncbi:chorismate--pyruvate lyase family protein [Thiofilum flexile]|uniref:chorismate--pyruvate lyase family protein n=1 Tax=Thiofilum flexile TaxID=125627 RepID=UPI00036B9CF8|nr:chorismate lyase [Thiofilum flexile]
MDSLIGMAWHPFHTDIPPQPTPPWLQAWLGVAGSLTTQLQTICQYTFQVQVLKHEFTPCSELMSKALGLHPFSSVLQREVLLCDGDTPLVFASSVLPEAALVDHYAELRELGARPLGHWIFAEPVLKRALMYYAELPSELAFFANIPPMAKSTPQLWGRQTLFTGALHPLVVSEFFLPALINYPQPNESIPL